MVAAAIILFPSRLPSSLSSHDCRRFRRIRGAAPLPSVRFRLAYHLQARGQTTHRQQGRIIGLSLTVRVGSTGQGEAAMTWARLWRTVATYLRTPIGGACVVAAGVALALALLVLPAVDDGFRSQPAASQGTALPAP
ncbi:MAG: hypothetical protein H0W59_02395, partial [Chloroflexia bacterium]|nr:hypothetical protein [Chloroflexia bacterium]